MTNNKSIDKAKQQQQKKKHKTIIRNKLFYVHYTLGTLSAQ